MMLAAYFIVLIVVGCGVSIAVGEWLYRTFGGGDVG